MRLIGVWAFLGTLGSRSEAVHVVNVREEYHAHFYYTQASRGGALQVYAKALKEFAKIADVKAPVDRPIGPHTQPMFEIAFCRQQLSWVNRWLMENRGEASVLVHPVLPDEIAAHSTEAWWLGEALPLNFSELKRNVVNEMGTGQGVRGAL